MSVLTTIDIPYQTPPSIDPSTLFPDQDEDGDEENIFRDMTFDEILEELNARFLVNLPKEEMGLIRVYWQAEQAHWFYEDYLRPLNPLLPSLSQRNFTHLIVASSPLYSHLSDDDYDAIWEEYCSYKRMVPCCGGILINRTGDKVLMVRGWKSNAGWSFPRGKINSEEPEEACAIREVEEETGFDLTGMISKKDSIQTQVNAQVITMFIVKGIDESTIFETQTRKEIGAIEWVPLGDLPTWTNKRGPKTTSEKGKKRFYNVTPFVGPLKRWLTNHGINPHPKKKAQHAGNASSQATALRPLEPFQFDSPPQSPQLNQPLQPHRSSSAATPAPAREPSALDHLFDRFINKQTEEMQDTGVNDNKAGLERLFGNLSVAKQSQSDIANKEREAKEDDALARLLGGISSTPAPQPPEPAPSLPATDRANRLLSMLRDTPSSGQTAYSQADISPTKSYMRPHQASLLAVLSPQLQNRSSSASTSSGDTAQPAMKHVSLPTSPRPPTPDHAQAERSRRQIQLLDQITAGIGIDVPSMSTHGLPPRPDGQAQVPLHTSQLPNVQRRRGSTSGHNSARRSSNGSSSPRSIRSPVLSEAWRSPGHLGGPPPPYESPRYAPMAASQQASTSMQGNNALSPQYTAPQVIRGQVSQFNDNNNAPQPSQGSQQGATYTLGSPRSNQAGLPPVMPINQPNTYMPQQSSRPPTSQSSYATATSQSQQHSQQYHPPPSSYPHNAQPHQQMPYQPQPLSHQNQPHLPNRPNFPPMQPPPPPQLHTGYQPNPGPGIPPPPNTRPPPQSYPYQNNGPPGPGRGLPPRPISLPPNQFSSQPSPSAFHNLPPMPPSQIYGGPPPPGNSQANMSMGYNGNVNLQNAQNGGRGPTRAGAGMYQPMPRPPNNNPLLSLLNEGRR